MTDTTPTPPPLGLYLDAIRARAEAATPGPWKLWGMTVMTDRAGTGNVDDADDIAFTTDPDRGTRTFNASFIAHAREDVPALLAEVEALRTERDGLAAYLAADPDYFVYHNEAANMVLALQGILSVAPSDALAEVKRQAAAEALIDAAHAMRPAEHALPFTFLQTRAAEIREGRS